MQKAVVTLLQEKAVVFDHKMKEQDGVDRIDLYLRNLLYQMRVLRLSSEIRGRVFLNVVHGRTDSVGDVFG